MRIIAGSLARRRLTAPSGRTTRPTGDRVREALFMHLQTAWLDGTFDGLDVLDLYAGSGALGLEALSRGARSVTFVEHDRGALRALEENVRTLEVRQQCRIVKGTLPAAAARLGGPFDLVLMDPPYAFRDVEALVQALEQTGALSDDALLVYEHAGDDPAPLAPDRLVHGTRTWGDTGVTIFAPRVGTVSAP